MTDIRILWLFSDLLDLYGDSGNLKMLKYRLEEMGHTCRIETPPAELPVEFGAYDLIYIGPGKIRNVAYAAECFAHYKDSFKAAVEKGTPCLVTGSGRLLLGESFQDEAGNLVKGVGLFPYTGRETGEVFVGDVVARARLAEEPLCYGFINRTAHLEGDCGEPLFLLGRGPSDGEGPAKSEGSQYKNLWATWCLGPLLVKNPQLCRILLHKILPEGEFRDYGDALERRALERTLDELPLKT